MTSVAEEKGSHFACSGLQVYVFYTAVEKCALASTLQMERVITIASFIFVGNSYLQQAGAGWNYSHRLSYHTNFILSHVTLDDANSFAFSTSIFISTE